MANLQEQQKQQLKELKASSTNIKQVIETGEISIYNDELVTKEVFASNILKIITAYPELPDHFFNLLKERVKDKKITSKRFNDAVNHVIDTFFYQKPAIANFISFDQNVKVMNYNQVIEFGLEYAESIDLFDVDDENRKCFWISKSDFEKYPNFKKWVPTKKIIEQKKTIIKIPEKTPEEKEIIKNEMISKKKEIEKTLIEIQAAKKKYPKKLTADEIVKLTPDEFQIYSKSIVRTSTIKENNLVTELNILKKNINSFTLK